MAAKRKKAAGSDLDPNAWMLTFSDMVTLLLTFFVMLLSMSTMDIHRVQKIFSSFTGGGGVLEFAKEAEIPTYAEELRKLSKLSLEQLPKEDILRDVVFGQTKPEADAVLGSFIKEIKIKRTDQGLALIFGAKILFDSASADLKPASRPLLERLAEIIKQVNRPVSIEGHTDDRPLAPTARFASNWDLSLARALAVRDILVDQMGVNPWRIRVAAMGSARPVAANDTPEGRAQNRRIEVVFQWLN